jgi:hypothetical protein
VRGEHLRRLHLAAQAGETLFFLMRPLAAAQDASPARLRLDLRPQPGGIEISFVKRRGPQRDKTLFLPLTSYLPNRHAPVDRTHLPLLPLEVFAPSWSIDTGSVVIERKRVLLTSHEEILELYSYCF